MAAALAAFVCKVRKWLARLCAPRQAALSNPAGAPARDLERLAAATVDLILHLCLAQPSSKARNANLQRWLD